MSQPSHPSNVPLPGARDGPPAWAVAAVLAILIALVYWRALQVPFIFDDHDTITRNTSIRSLWPLIGTDEHRGPLNPIRDLPTSARPVVNYSFALNYHFWGLSLAEYHAVNLVIHFLNAFLLWVIVRRVLRLPYFAGRFDSVAGWLAFVVALLWMLHPLHSEVAVYVTQRTELLVAFFYLATFYCSLRYWSCLRLPPGEGRSFGEPGEGVLQADKHPHHRTTWLVLSILACLFGMLSKEVMVSAPLIILLFERTFISGSFANSLRRSWPLYLGMALTWIPLIVLSMDKPRSYSSGFHLCDNIIRYWFTQCKVVLMYLKLSIWPWPLRCAYELPKVDNLVTFCLYVVPVLLLAALALWLLWRNRPLGFVMVFVGAVLAPTSIMPILTEMAAERRMYLPLAALMVVLVAGIYLFAKRQIAISVASGETSPDSNAPRAAAIASVGALTLLYGAVCAMRLSDYFNEERMWKQVADSQPQNHIAHYNLGIIYNEQGRDAESLAELEAAIAAHNRYPSALSARGFALMNAGRMPEAIASIQSALDINPNDVAALNNMGIALTRLGHYPEAIEYLQKAVQLNPSHADAHHNLGQALMADGRKDEAAEQLQIARSLTPDDPDVLVNLALSHYNNNELPQAIELLERALKLKPDLAKAHINLGNALARSGDARGAVEHFRRFQELKPDDPAAYFNLARVAEDQGDHKQAADLYEQVLKRRPDAADAHSNLADNLVHLGQPAEAAEHYETALRLNPKYVFAYLGLANALASTNRLDEAKRTAERGLEIANSQNDTDGAKKLKDWLTNGAK